VQRQTYLVQPGDNLYRISLRFGVTMRALQEVNGIVNVNLLYAGQVLVIP
jgi:LysM repeat protein